MKEIWLRSEGANDPARVDMRRSSGLVGAWWLVYLLSGFAGRVAMNTSGGAEGIDALKRATIAVIVTDLFTILSGLLAFLLVARIIGMQMKMAEDDPGADEPEPPSPF